MECSILGPLAVTVSGGPVAVRGERARTLFVALVLASPDVVPVERLIDLVWGDAPPAGARENLRVYVSRLRKELGAEAERLATVPDGYRLALAAAELDANRFASTVAEARSRLAEGDAEGAVERLQAGLAMWRGPALADLAHVPFVAAQAARLEESRLAALEVRIDAELACGRHASLVGELEALCAEHPFRERFRAQHMLALYRSGRQGEALRSYQRLRDVVVEELGIEPGPEARRLEAAILAQDPSLDAPDAARLIPAPAEGTARTVRVMLVDDHPIWRDATRAVLEREPDLAVVAEAGDAASAIATAAEAAPEVVLMDVSLPDGTGTAVARALLADAPEAKVVMLSSSGAEGSVVDAIRAGATGYLLKTATAREIVDAVRRAVAGDAVFTPALASVVLQEARGGPGRSPLSARQRDVLRHIGDGADPATAASRLGLTEAEVRVALDSVVSALQADAGGDGDRGRRVRAILFVDIADSTRVAAVLGDAAWLAKLREFNALTGDAIAAAGGTVVKQVGDGVLAVSERPADMVRAAVAILHSTGGIGLAARAGIHLGECQLVDHDALGLAVHIAARVVAEAGANEVLATHTVHDVVLGSTVRFADRGLHELRGVPGQWRLFAAVTDDEADV